MLIPDFIFVRWQDPDHQPPPYPLKLHCSIGAYCNYSRFNRTACPERFGTTASERCLVLLPCSGIKPVIYCTSIRQRERSCFRQINFWPSGLWSTQPSLRMLTYHLNPLSNPVRPNDAALSRAYSYAKIMQTSEKKTCFQFPECSLSCAKVQVFERNELLLSRKCVPLRS